MIFFMPFFFLLVDCFLLFPLVPFWVAPWAGEQSVLAGSAACPGAAWAASVFDAGSAVVVAPVVPFTESLVVVAAVFGPVDPAGAFGSGCAAVLGSAPSVAGATFSAPPLVVPPVLPVTIVATIPVPVPTRASFPPVNTSIPASLSASGVIVGFPVLAATRNSCPGPLRTRPMGFLIRLSRCRGAFCSAVIQATALGSGCGTGAPCALSRFLASGTSGDSG